MFIAFGAADALDEAAAEAAAGVAEVAGDVLLEPLELQAASARAVAANAATAAQRPKDRVAGIESTAKLLCAYSLGGGLADRPVGRVPARLTGFYWDQLDAIIRASRDQAVCTVIRPPLCGGMHPCLGILGNGLMSGTRSLSLIGSVSVSLAGVKSSSPRQRQMRLSSNVRPAGTAA